MCANPAITQVHVIVMQVLRGGESREYQLPVEAKIIEGGLSFGGIERAGRIPSFLALHQSMAAGAPGGALLLLYNGFLDDVEALVPDFSKLISGNLARISASIKWRSNPSFP